MGAGSSKPGSSASQHVFVSETPVRFSQDLVDSLQASTETDSTRQKTLELHIQQRVQEELRKIQERESLSLRDLQDNISAEPTLAAPDAEDGSSNLSSAFAPADAKAAGAHLRNINRESVAAEVKALKEKLEKRKKIVEEDKGVEQAKGKLVECLRMNDRRPLDCYKEVEAFRKEVGRLEEQFVGKVIG